MKQLSIILSGILLLGIAGFCCHRYALEKRRLCDVTSLPLTRVRSGDLIFSEGHSFKSDLVRIAARNYHCNYSHVGFLRRHDTDIHVVHMSIDDGCILEESLGDFVRRNRVRKIGIGRLQQGPDTLRFCQVLDSLLALGKPFDYKFDMEDDMTYYCTELICKTLHMAGVESFAHLQADGVIYPPALLNDETLTLIN